MSDDPLDLVRAAIERADDAGMLAAAHAGLGRMQRRERDSLLLALVEEDDRECRVAIIDGSLTATYEIADRALGRDVPTVLLHVGDHDPSGESIFESLAVDAAAFVQADRVLATIELRAVRVALTAEQVTERNLPTAPPKGSDSRSARWEGETCQLEALAPDELATVVRDAIEDHLDFDAYHRQLCREHVERQQLLGLPQGGREAR